MCIYYLVYDRINWTIWHLLGNVKKSIYVRFSNYIICSLYSNQIIYLMAKHSLVKIDLLLGKGLLWWWLLFTATQATALNIATTETSPHHTYETHTTNCTHEVSVDSKMYALKVIRFSKSKRKKTTFVFTTFWNAKKFKRTSDRNAYGWPTSRSVCS